METKIKFKNLSMVLKIAIIFTYIFGTLYTLLFIVNFILALVMI